MVTVNLPEGLHSCHHDQIVTDHVFLEDQTIHLAVLHDPAAKEIGLYAWVVVDRCHLFFALILDGDLDVVLLLGNGYSEELDVVILNENLVDPGHIVENETFGKALGHAGSRILAVVVGSVMDCIVLDNTGVLETAFVGAKLHDNRELVANVII